MITMTTKYVKAITIFQEINTSLCFLGLELFYFFFLQDFEAITPNLLARTVETIEGGGIIVFLLKSVNSLKQLYTMAMVVFFLKKVECTYTFFA